MACPSGCLNGGGQIRSSTADREALKGKLRQVEELYVAGSGGGMTGEDEDPVTMRIYKEIVNGPPGSPQARDWFSTQYHAVPPMNSGLLIKW
jgi:iron only hydrogenase large subunit-like protein